MNADTLRRAAALMRERAQAAHEPTGQPPRWHVAQNRHPNSDGAPWGAVEYQRHPAGGAGPRVMTWSGDAAKADAEHVASWHPAVALAVADWLDSVALAERHEVNGADIHNALTVARTYLGESS